jgi:predicted small metal-binding protein
MAETLKQIECEPKCGFLVRSHDEAELIRIAIEHGEKAHGMKMTEKDARELMKAA